MLSNILSNKIPQCGVLTYQEKFYLQDINSPTDSVIGRDFQELSAEEQERQREEWKAELKKTEEEILTLKQVLTAKERHAAGNYHLLGSTFLIILFTILVFRSQKTSGNYSLERVLRGHDPGPKEPPGVRHLQADR